MQKVASVYGTHIKYKDGVVSHRNRSFAETLQIEHIIEKPAAKNIKLAIAIPE